MPECEDHRNKVRVVFLQNSLGESKGRSTGTTPQIPVSGDRGQTSEAARGQNTTGGTVTRPQIEQGQGSALAPSVASKDTHGDPPIPAKTNPPVFQSSAQITELPVVHAANGSGDRPASFPPIKLEQGTTGLQSNTRSAKLRKTQWEMQGK
ncbi:hypothetical protein BCR34DRAFT_336488 [Clohesyomyces aquaticus]|uniref:Uncharacterized protein n=1 Tax=Clohesyomyces aquaticus TaxID=1231657 RepID=A0A1Y1ZL51_9PLEO|nr:hypothetical protein BCR34DRAFT_336488 [Clohesyomyces aquaticus]